MVHIAQNINELRTHIPPHVKIVAVSKTKSVTEIREAIGAGQHVFGENKVQELIGKYEQIPEAEWHFVGHLQTNKIKHIVPFIRMIHSADSFRLIEEINNRAGMCNRVIDCLLQIHIAREETKFGMSEDETLELLDTPGLHDMKNIRICGLMGVATFTDNKEAVRGEFRGLANFFRRIKREFFPTEASFCELSMGMSDDYDIAVEEGSTMVRIGSLIFGERVYGTGA